MRTVDERLAGYSYSAEQQVVRRLDKAFRAFFGRVKGARSPIESVFATVRHRTVRTKGALSQDTAKLMVFKLISAAPRTWRRLQGENQLPKVIRGVKFRDGIEVNVPTSQSAA